MLNVACNWKSIPYDDDLPKICVVIALYGRRVRGDQAIAIDENEINLSH